MRSIKSGLNVLLQMLAKTSTKSLKKYGQYSTIKSLDQSINETLTPMISGQQVLKNLITLLVNVTLRSLKIFGLPVNKTLAIRKTTLINVNLPKFNVNLH